MQALNDLHTYCTANRIKLVFTSVIGSVRDTFVKEGFAQNLGADHFFEQIDDATSKFLDLNRDAPTNPIKFQTNISS